MVVSSDVAELAGVRAFVDRAATMLGTTVARPDLAVATSELVANAMALDAGDVAVCVSLAGLTGVRLEVTDAGPGVPQVVDQEAWDPEGHRGLQIIEQIAEHWGVDRRSGEKVVWCELPSSARAQGGHAFAGR
jgi:anti-sigma regulatory factor (Ser/Thr protein kinase)